MKKIKIVWKDNQGRRVLVDKEINELKEQKTVWAKIVFMMFVYEYASITEYFENRKRIERRFDDIAESCLNIGHSNCSFSCAQCLLVSCVQQAEELLRYLDLE